MLTFFINFFTKLGFKKIVVIALKGLSSFYSHNYNFFYSKPFWAAKKESKVYIDYLIDPRIASIDDSCSLYRDIFFYDYQIKLQDVIVDIGAGLGHETLVFNEVLENSGLIFLVEATPSTFLGLEKTIELNQFENCNCYNLAISDKDEGYIEISNSTEEHLSRSIFNNNLEEKDLVKVKQITMDSFIEREDLNEIDLLVINIEGFESNLIKTFSKIRQVKNIAISCHDFLYYREPSEKNIQFLTSDIIKTFLIDNGFRIKERNSGIDYIDSYIYGKRI